MRIVFFGTPDYVVPVLDKLHKTFKGKSGTSPVIAVVTQKPKPVGRKQILTYSPVDNWAHKKGVEKFYSSKKLLESGIKADAGILAAYGEILPKEVLNDFPHGILNIHPSLLPKSRGASPVQATIITGEEAGATIIKLDEKMDHGPIIAQFKEDVKESDTTQTLRSRLFEQSAEVLVTLFPAHLKGEVTPRAQNHREATYTTLVKKTDAFLPPKYLKAYLRGQTPKAQTPKAGWNIPFIRGYSLVPSAYSLDHFIRAMQPWPVAWTLLRLHSSGQAKRMKILKTHVEKHNTRDVRHNTKDKTYPVSRIPYLVLDEVQLEGKNPVSWQQFTEAYPNHMFLNA